MVLFVCAETLDIHVMLSGLHDAIATRHLSYAARHGTITHPGIARGVRNRGPLELGSGLGDRSHGADPCGFACRRRSPRSVRPALATFNIMRKLAKHVRQRCIIPSGFAAR